MKKLLLSFICFSSLPILAASIELNGAMRFDTTRIQEYRRTDTDTSTLVDGHIIKGSEDVAAISTYIFRLNPEVIVNDHVTVKAELSTGHSRGGTSGENQTAVQKNFQNQFFQNHPQGSKAVNFNQYYMEIYSDIATYKVGKFSKGWGLGALYNEGKNPEDRFFTSFEGVEANLSLGKIFINPYFAFFGDGKGYTHSNRGSEMGISALYDNTDSDQKLGILWSQRKSGSNDGLFVDANGDNEISVTLIDFYYQKLWEKFSLAIEVPYIDGDIKGPVKSTFKPSAYIGEFGYNPTESFNLKLKAGYVSGDANATDGKTENMFLNPNYKVSRLMFNYNYNTVEADLGDINDASITNATFARIAATYSTGIWNWTASVLWAQASEVLANQEKDLGLEAGVEFEYLWNPKLSVEGFLSYHLAGKYFEYTSTGSIETKNPIGGGLAVNLKF